MRPLPFPWRGRRAGRLRLLVLAISDRCDQKCAHCQIWSGAGAGPGLSLEQRTRVVDDALRAGAEAVLLTGGEPLLSPHLWPLAERVKAAGGRLLLATNGMLLEAHAPRLGALVDEVYLSLDGASASSHDALRGVAAFSRLEAGVAALRRAAPGPLLVARTTLHAGNLHEFPAIVEAARRLGVDHVSFLPLDASSGAFGGRPEARGGLVPAAAQLAAFEADLDRFEGSAAARDGFVLEAAPKLRRLAAHLRASAGLAAFQRPGCDAPLWSSVVESDGSLRPCFFHAPVGSALEGLDALRRSRRYREALRTIRGPNTVCERCVCPKQGAPGRPGRTRLH